jgi:hypothetical protein
VKIIIHELLISYHTKFVQYIVAASVMVVTWFGCLLFLCYLTALNY